MVTCYSKTKLTKTLSPEDLLRVNYVKDKKKESLKNTPRKNKLCKGSEVLNKYHNQFSRIFKWYPRVFVE